MSKLVWKSSLGREVLEAGKTGVFKRTKGMPGYKVLVDGEVIARGIDKEDAILQAGEKVKRLKDADLVVACHVAFIKDGSVVVGHLSVEKVVSMVVYHPGKPYGGGGYSMPLKPGANWRQEVDKYAASIDEVTPAKEVAHGPVS